MDRDSFISLFKDLVSRLYDPLAIETHPLAPFFPSGQSSARRGEVIQKMIQEEIACLRPEGKEEQSQSPEWRPYLILKKRYIEGEDPHQIANSLYIGDRQFRRDHSRALDALSLRIWEKHFKTEKQITENGGLAENEEQGEFEVHTEELDINEVVSGVGNLINRRLEIENVKLELDLCKVPIHVMADRVLLRQVLLSLLNYVLHLRGDPRLILRTRNEPVFSIEIHYDADEQWANIQQDELGSLEFARRLGQRLPAIMEEKYPSAGTGGPAAIILQFSGSEPRTVLIVDDQLAAHKMLQRYLSRMNLQVIGTTDSSQCVQIAQEQRPSLIILDVMMPRFDGWEILQNLQMDPKTRNIPVVICSAWGEPELARSLGAVFFLKKPVIQKDLLDALARLGFI